MHDALNMSGKVVVVTGGGKGVGRGISSRFLEAGGDVVICGRTQPDVLPSGGGKQALFIAADIRQIEQIEQLIAFTIERCGRLDVLVNNAGGTPSADAATASPRFS
jgi:NAD(P)-dependent dehydrogenase (short-subunit alcohol dehydrogenase family)